MLFRREAFPPLPPPPVLGVKRGRGDGSSRAQGLPSPLMFPRFNSIFKGGFFKGDHLPLRSLSSGAWGGLSISALGRRGLISLQALEAPSPEAGCQAKEKSDLKPCPRRFMSGSSSRSFCRSTEMLDAGIGRVSCPSVRLPVALALPHHHDQPTQPLCSPGARVGEVSAPPLSSHSSSSSRIRATGREERGRELAPLRAPPRGSYGRCPPLGSPCANSS